MIARPLVIVEDATAYRAVLAELRGAGWTAGTQVVDGVDVLDLAVAQPPDAQRAVLAAVGGSGVLVRAQAPRAVLDDLVEDLGRLGRVVVADTATVVTLDVDTWRLLHALAVGDTVAAAARALHLSTRTANRRVTEARAVFTAPTRAHLVRAVTGPGRIRPPDRSV